MILPFVSVPLTRYVPAAVMVAVVPLALAPSPFIVIDVVFNMIPVADSPSRITSYNVCYTKLLRTKSDEK